MGGETEAAENAEEAQAASKYVIYPDSRFKICWDSVQLFVLIYLSIMLPYRTGLSVAAFGYFFVLETAMDAFFLVDIVIQFLTALPDNTHKNASSFITDLGQIKRTYLKSWFITDVIASIPIDVILRTSMGILLCSMADTCHRDHAHNLGEVSLLRMLRMLRLIKLAKFLRVAKVVNVMMDRLGSKSAANALDMLRHLFPLIYLGHVFGCFFYYFSGEEFHTKEEVIEILNGVRTTWRIENFGYPYGHPRHMAWITTNTQKYVASIYWAFTTMTTVGYGDISATTISERVFACIGMVSGGFMFSMVLAKVNMKMQNSNLKKGFVLLQQEKFEVYLELNNIPRKLRKRVDRAIDNKLWKSSDSQDVLHQLPFQLRMELVLFTYQNLINASPLLAHAFRTSVPFLVALCSLFYEDIVLKDDIIVEEGEPMDPCFFMVECGMVAVVCRRRKMCVTELGDGAHFGEGILAGRVCWPMTVVATTPIVKLVKVPVEPFLKIMKCYPDMRDILVKMHYNRMEVWSNAYQEANGSVTTDLANDQNGKTKMLADMFSHWSSHRKPRDMSSQGMPTFNPEYREQEEPIYGRDKAGPEVSKSGESAKVPKSGENVMLGHRHWCQTPAPEAECQPERERQPGTFPDLLSLEHRLQMMENSIKNLADQISRQTFLGSEDRADPNEHAGTRHSSYRPPDSDLQAARKYPMHNYFMQNLDDLSSPDVSSINLTNEDQDGAL
mmetsp:Transcript_35060/g.59003  ORF Transcript_35060/g.59003 Transcript_35060/m.59003 type:complete len:726 (-) Transcript_35060:383-2560(-)